MRQLGPFESIHDNLARDAAIAEMARRLAAPGLRARRRQQRQLTASRDRDDDRPAAAWTAPQPVTRDDALAARPVQTIPARPLPGMRLIRELPWARTLDTFRRVTLLGATAACGFAAVLYAEKLRVTAPTRHAMASLDRIDTVPEANRSAAQATPAAPIDPPAVIETFAEAKLPPPPPLRLFIALEAPAMTIVDSEIPATHGPSESASRHAAPAARTSVQASTPPAHVSHLVLSRPVLVSNAGARERPGISPSRPAPHATLARFEFPRWLTERRAVPAPSRIMSEPAHDLTASHATTAPPRVVYALASPTADPYRYKLPALRRPAFYVTPPHDAAD